MAKHTRVVVAACDGACSGNPGPGGWGALLKFEDGAVKEMGGYAPATTNNRMELTAALELMRELQDLPRHPDLVILTDSKYLVDGLQKWIGGWKRKGWRTASGSPVLNRDLWEELDQARVAGVGLEHVRGHSGHPDNDRCDAIAVAYSRGGSPTLASPGPAPKATKAAPAETAGSTAVAQPPGAGGSVGGGGLWAHGGGAGRSGGEAPESAGPAGGAEGALALARLDGGAGGGGALAAAARRGRIGRWSATQGPPGRSISGCWVPF